MRFSIIIPAVNEAARIAQAVRAASAFGPDEVIVVDGGSRDSTPAEARAAGAVVFTSPPGRGVQQNRGAARATGDVLVFAHADARLPAAAAADVRTAIANAAPDRVVWGCFRQAIDDPRRVFRIIERGNALRATTCGWVYGDQGLWVKAEAFRQVGGFPEEPLLEDLVLSRRLRQRFGRPALVDRCLEVDARRWQRHGAIRQTLRNWSILARYFLLGQSPASLARAYRRHDVG